MKPVFRRDNLLPIGRLFLVVPLLLAMALTGCGTTKSSVATEQLLASDAVDHAVAQVDFSPLRDQKVYFNTTYIRSLKGVGFVNADYVIASLRQQMMASGLLLFDKEEEAEFIVEIRVGTLGADAHEVSFGIPSTTTLSQASTAVSTYTGGPALPGLPEMSAVKRNDNIAAAKIGAIAYERESRQAVWQSGISIGKSKAKDLWVFGAGPFQEGSIRTGDLAFNDSPVEVPLIVTDTTRPKGPVVAYQKPALYKDLTVKEEPVVVVSGEEEESESKVVPASAESK